MAEPIAENGVASSSQVGDQSLRSDGAPIDHPQTSNSQTSQETTSTSFQAVNARAVAENASTAVNTAAPPPDDDAVAQDASQTAQTSLEASSATKTSTQVDDLDSSMAADAASYGTRSRNRTGNARPNYAEDQDVDLDSTSAATTKKKHAIDTAAVSAGHNNAEAKRAQEFARLIAGNGTSTANGTKESTPGTPGLASSSSKKRKAAGPPTVLTQTPPASNSPAPPAARKPTAPSSLNVRETNVMTFTKQRSCLNNKGELVADDGTKLSVNGKYSPDQNPKSRIWEVLPYPASTSAIIREANHS